MPDSHDSPGRALQRIVDTPHLARAVPRLPAEVLHRVIRHHGLEDSAELVALATPEQLTRVFDLDLWKSARPGLDEQFDAGRFGTWLQVLLEGAGAEGAARTLAAMPAESVIAGLAQHVRVFDPVTIAYETLDGQLVETRVDGNAVTCEVGGYRLDARREDAWDAIVEVLLALDAGHRARFDLLMRRCRALSNSAPEASGMHDLLDDPEQAMFDLAADREQRRERAGYATPAQARAFLDAARRLASGVVPPPDPVAAAYFRALDDAAAVEREEAPADAPPATAAESLSSDDVVAEVIEVLRESGLLATTVRALPAGPPARLARIHAALHHVGELDDLAIRRQGELGYLANVLIAGCSIQGRPLELQEASDAVLATCNLGLEHWPLPVEDDVLVTHDLVQLFQIGWTVLHREAGLFAARTLLAALSVVRVPDRELQIALRQLRVALTAQVDAGTPWKARASLDPIATLDAPAWAALRGLLDECPVLQAGLFVPPGTKPLSVSPAAFDFISGRDQIAAAHAFLAALPEMLT